MRTMALRPLFKFVTRTNANLLRDVVLIGRERQAAEHREQPLTLMGPQRTGSSLGYSVVAQNGRKWRMTAPTGGGP